MKIKDFFTRKTTQKEEKKPTPFSQNPDPALISSDNGEYTFLSDAETLSTSSLITAKGTWNKEDFIYLKTKLKTGLSSLAANAILKEVDLGSVKLESHCTSIDYQALFNFCVNLESVVLPNADEFKGEVNFQATFRGCRKLKTIDHFGTYQHISNLSATFCFCSLLTKIEIACIPLPKGDLDTFQKVNRDIKIKIRKETNLPSTWTQINPENIHIYNF